MFDYKQYIGIRDSISCTVYISCSILPRRVSVGVCTSVPPPDESLRVDQVELMSADV